MERWARERPRRQPGQPSFSSTLLDAICNAMDEQPAGAATYTATERAAKEQQDVAALHCYYYKPSLAASRHREAPVAEDDCRGYFSSSEVEYSLRPIRTSSRAAVSAPHAEKQQQQKTQAWKTATGTARVRPASPGARLAGLLNAIFTGKRHSARQHLAPPDDEPAAAPSTARPCFAKTPSARASRSRTVRFLDMDGEVAVAAVAAGCRHIPVEEVEVEEVVLRPAECDVGEGSSDASSDLFELESLAAVDPAGGGGGQQRRACGDELPVYGTTAVGLRGGVVRVRGHPWPELQQSSVAHLEYVG
jgi:hypothetical protein